MTPPYYTVTVYNLTRGWSYTVTHDSEDPTDATPVWITDPLEYSWAFADDMIPSPDLFFTAKVNLACHTADDVPEVQTGDRMELGVKLPAGPYLIDPTAMRVSSAEVTLTSGRYAARLAIGLVDLSVDWRNRELIGGVGTAPQLRMQWRERLAEQAKLLGLPMGAPTSWPGTAQPVHPFATGSPAIYTLSNYMKTDGYPGKAAEAIGRTLNSYQPNGYPHTMVTLENGVHPAGYSYVGPSSWDPSTGWGAIAESAAPFNSERIELVPAGRNTPSSAGLPLQFVVDGGGLLTLAPLPPTAGGGLAQLGIDAAWCVIPARARRSRESVINQVVMKGDTGVTDSAGTGAEVKDGTYIYSTADATARGASPREPGTELYLGNRYTHITNSWPVPWPAVTAAAGYFVADDAALAAPWTYDEFELHPRLMTDTEASNVLAMVAPRKPGEPDSDGRLVRHITIYNLAPEVRFAAQPVLGFVVGGTLTIRDGEMVFNLATIPGAPIYTGGSVTPVTVGDVTTGFPTVHIEAVDPLILLADLAYVDH